MRHLNIQQFESHLQPELDNNPDCKTLGDTPDQLNFNTSKSTEYLNKSNQKFQQDIKTETITLSK